jgi:hypothetical protein
VQIPVRHHYLPLTAMGRTVALAHRVLKTARHKVKSNPALLALAKRVRTAMHKPKTEAAAD